MSNKEFNDMFDQEVLAMVEEGLITMGWSEEKEEVVFWATEEQKVKLKELYG